MIAFRCARRPFHSLLLLSAAFLAASALFAQDQKPNSALSQVVADNNKFAIALYQNIGTDTQSKNENIFVSPFSISTALAMTYAGSSGNTRTQIASVFEFTLPDDKLQAGFSDLLAQTRSTPAKRYTLNVANALWGQKNFHFEPAFIQTIGKYYSGGFNTVDYISDRDASRAAINKWVETETSHKIVELVHEDDLTADTRLVLTNAIYFKGDWSTKFRAEDTADASFTLDSGKIVKVPMMKQTGHFPFAENSELSMIELPYAGGDLSMIVILPKNGIEKFGATLSPAKLKGLCGNMRTQRVSLFLPKFKFETRYYLERALSAMGMPDAFDEHKADFSAMTGHPDLYISHAIHQAMIEVNEEGSVAAAATAVVMDLKSFEPLETFRADRPFIFLIVHKPTDSILFMGRVSNPVNAASSDAKQ